MSYVLSPHSLSLYSECKRCFWQSQIDGISRPSGPFPSLPSGMDLALKRHFDSFLAKSPELPPAISELSGSLLLFDDQVLLKKWRGRDGLSWVNSKGDMLKGSLDNLLVDDKGTLVVLDYKTRGFKPKTGESGSASYYIQQMNTYNLLLRKNGRATADYSFLLFYYPKEVREDGLIEFNAELHKVGVDVKRAERQFSGALRTLYGEKPKSSKDCSFCAWARQSK